MRDDANRRKRWWRRQADDQKARALRHAKEQASRALRQAAGQEEEWLRQSGLIYGGLIGVGVVLVQPFLTAGSLDLPAAICVVAFAVAIPLLAALILVNRQESFRRRTTPSRTVKAARAFAQLSAFVGVVAAFWHIHRIAGVVILATSLIALGVHSAGFWRLEKDHNPGLQDQPGDSGSA